MRVYHFPPPIWQLEASVHRCEAAAHIRHSYLGWAWRQAGPSRKILFAIAGLFWPVTAALLSAWSVCTSGGVAKRVAGKGFARQFVEQYIIALCHAIMPRYYYIFEFFDPARRAECGEYLHRFETKGGIYSMLRRSETAREVGRPLHDKHTFFEFCERRGLASAPVLLAFKDGAQVTVTPGADRLPSVDLFVKPTSGRGGNGAEKWLRVGEGWERRGERLGAAALLERLRRQSVTEPMILQPALRVHASLADLSLQALSTVRIVTMFNEAGNTEALNAVFRMPRDPNSAVDNFHAGGIAAAIDMQTGRLGAATDLGVGTDTAWHRCHPITGAPIAGRVLPYWQDVKELACRVHQTMQGRVIVGWDIAILDGGAMLIEGNSCPDLDIHQRAERRPLGSARLGRLLSHHIHIRQEMLGRASAQDQRITPVF